MKKPKRGLLGELCAMLGLSIVPVLAWAAAGSISYQYDETGRLKTTSYLDGTQRSYGLDAAGNRLSTSETVAVTVLTLSISGTVGESAGFITGTVTRAGSSSAAVTVQYSTSNGSASAGADYSATSDTLSWGSGDTAAKTFSIPILADSLYEGTETFNVTLTSPTGGAVLGTPNQATVSIADDDATPNFSIADVSIGEANASVTLTVTKSGSTVFTHTVNYATANGTASAGSNYDYTATSGTLSFATSETSKTIVVPLTNDSVYEGNETFVVTLSSPSNGAVISAGTGTVTIIEDDAAPDTTPPSVPAGLTANAVSSTQVNLSWGTSTDTGGSGLAGYRVYRGGVQIGTSSSTSYSDTTTSGTTTYSYTVSAYDNANNNSAQSASAPVTTPDTITPDVPTGLGATPVSSSQINLTWTASSDTGGSGLAGYRIYRNGVQVNTSPGASYSDTGLSGTTTYTYTVAAYDGAGNVSSQSASAQATTLYPTDYIQLNAQNAFNANGFLVDDFSQGFWVGNIGSVTPAYDSSGKQISYIYNQNGYDATFGYRALPGDPGQGYLISITVNGVTLNGSAASYQYYSSGGVNYAAWSWSASTFGIVSGQTYTVTLVHQ